MLAITIELLSKYSKDISELDLSSNNPYFVKIEELSRKKYVNNPPDPIEHIHFHLEI